MKTITLTRADTSALSRWWWTVDRLSIAAVLVLMMIGLLLLLAAGPAAAARIHASTPYFFIKKQIIFLPFSLAVMFSMSLTPPRFARRIGVFGYLGAIVLLILAPLTGDALKGAARWIQFGPFSIQPSEFVKPTFAVATAWLLSEARTQSAFPGSRIALGLYLLTTGLIIIQPDLGQTMIVTAVWGTQFFLAVPSALWIIGLVVLGTGLLVTAYSVFPHVRGRMDCFLSPESCDTYQIRTALRAFRDGGLFGRGPGEGEVKAALPDGHTDFIFAVAGEEFGLFLCVFMALLFAFIAIRSMHRALKQPNLFILIAVGGLSVQIALQALINMASSLRMIPTKGMTLPFVSYGGSSLLATAIGMGLLLAFTRVRTDGDPINGERR